MGQLPPAGLSLVVMLNPRPCGPFVNSMATFLPILRVLAANMAVAVLRTSVPEDPGPPLLVPLVGSFFVEETVATFVCIPTTAKNKNVRINLNEPKAFFFW